MKIFKYILTLFFFIFVLFISINNISALTSITSCQNITSSGSYILNREINYTDTTNDYYGCLRIKTDDVQIDLNGTEIRGMKDISTSNGIYLATTYTNISIYNGSITNFTDNGIRARFCKNMKFYDLNIFNNSDYGVKLDSNSGTFTYNTTFDNVNLTDNTNGGGYFAYGDNITIKNSNITGDSYGLRFIYLNNSFSLSNDFNNLQYGIRLDNSHNNRIRNGNFSGISTNAILFGVSTTFQEDNVIRNNTISGNSSEDCITNDAGDYGADNLTIYKNNITSCRYGIDLVHTKNTNVTGNHLYDIDYLGIRSRGEGIVNNTNIDIFENNITNITWYGIFMWQTSDSLINNNDISEIYNKSHNSTWLITEGHPSSNAIYLLSSPDNNITNNRVVHSQDGYYIESPDHYGAETYNVSIHNNNATDMIFRGAHNDGVANCILSDFLCTSCYIGIRATDSGYGNNFTNITLIGGRQGIYISTNSNFTIKDYGIYNQSRWGIHIDSDLTTYGGSYWHEFRDGTISTNSSKDADYNCVSVESKADLIVFVNTTLGDYTDESDIYTESGANEAEIYWRWWWNATVQYNNGTPANNVNITAFRDIDGNRIFTQFSDTNGEFIGGSLSEWYQAGNTRINYTPMDFYATLNTDWVYNRLDYTWEDNNISMLFNLSDTVGPRVLLISPKQNSEDSDGKLDFYYNVTDTHDVTNCSLFIDGEYRSTDTTITKDETQVFSLDTPYASERMSWLISCNDEFYNNGNSSTNYLKTKIGGSSPAGGGGGGGVTSKVTVVAFNQTNELSKVYSDLERAKFYSEFYYTCGNLYSVSDCNLKDSELNNIWINLQKITIVPEQDVSILYNMYLNGDLINTDINELGSENLVKAILGEIIKFEVTPARFDTFALKLSDSPTILNIKPSKKLSECEVVSKSSPLINVSCVVDEKKVSGQIIVHIPNNLLSDAYDGKIAWVSESNEIIYQDFRVRMINLNYKNWWTIGMPFWFSIIFYTLILGSILYFTGVGRKLVKVKFKRRSKN